MALLKYMRWAREIAPDGWSECHAQRGLRIRPFSLAGAIPEYCAVGVVALTLSFSIVSQPAISADLNNPQAICAWYISGAVGSLADREYCQVSVFSSETMLKQVVYSTANLTNIYNALTNDVIDHPTENYFTRSPSTYQQISGLTGTGGTWASFHAMNSFGSVLMNGSNGVVPGETALGYADDGKAAILGAAFDALDPAAKSAAAAKLLPVFDPHWSIWTGAYGASGTVEGNRGTGSVTTQSQVAGLVVGAEKYLSATSILGFGMGGGGTNFSLGNGMGSGHSDLFQAGATFKQYIGNAYISGGLSYGWQNMTTNHTVFDASSGDYEVLQGKFDSSSLQERVEAGNQFNLPFGDVTPFAAAQLTSLFIPTYAETHLQGTSYYPINYAANMINDPRTEFGLKFNRRFEVMDALVTFKSSIAWAYDYNVSNAVNASFQLLPNATFKTYGAEPSPNSAIVSAGTEVRWTNGWSIGGAVKGEFSDTTTEFESNVSVKYTW